MNIGLSNVLEIKPLQDKVEVYVKNSQTNELVRVGTTPLTIEYADIAENYAKSKNFMMVMKKEKYIDYKIMISKLSSGKYEIKPNLESFSSKKFGKKYDSLITELFDVQRLTRSQNYEGALSKLKRLETSHSDMSVIYEMKAMVFYMMKNLPESLSQYRKAASVDPSNKEVYTMKKYLEKELVPSGKGK